MGRTSQNPKGHVFTFRADDETAELIRAAAADYRTVSEFLLAAVQVKAVDDAARVRGAA